MIILNIKQLLSFLLLSLISFTCVAVDAPEIVLSGKKIDLGVVKHGEVVQGSFSVINNGNKVLDVTGIDASCGCTVIDFQPSQIEAGATESFNFSVDTFGKIGEVRKKITVRSNDPENPEAELYVYMRIQMADHESVDSSVIFKETCEFCHAQPAKGKRGEELFEAVCYMCHGHYGLGGIAQRINDFGYVSNYGDDYFKKVITEGVAGTSMPGFSKEKGGPLDDEQIESLVKLMRWWEEGYVFKQNELRQ